MLDPTVAAIFDRARRHHQERRLEQAQALYREVLARAPQHPEALLLLGVLLAQEGGYDEAVALLRRAAQQRPADPNVGYNLGHALERSGRADEAAAAYRAVLALDPAYARAHYRLAGLLRARGDREAALHHYREAVQCMPALADAHFQLALLLRDEGEETSARIHLGQVLGLEPDNVPARCALADLMLEGGAFDGAVGHYQHVLRLQPGRDDVLIHLARALRALGRFPEAADAYRKALALKPDAAAYYDHLGQLYAAQERLDEAAAAYRRAQQARPDYAAAAYHLGQVLRTQGRVDEAQAQFEAALRLAPDDRTRLALAILLPPLYASTESVHEWRARFAAGVAALLADGVQLDPAQDVPGTGFPLALQGMNDRDLQRDVARLYRAPGPAVLPARPRRADRRIHVGFLSRAFRDHPVGRLVAGVVDRLARNDFTVTVFSVGRPTDAMARFFRERADRYVALPDDVRWARGPLADAAPDVLLYAGMDPTSYGLAFARLAPVQAVTWGVPGTTGIPALGYFLSSTFFETEEADAHYTERLVRLPSLGTCYARPTPPAPLAGREYFGLSRDAHLYVCPHPLARLHPDFDALLTTILRRDRRGLLVLLEAPYPAWTARWMERFRRSLPEAPGRVQFIRPQDHPAFLNLLALADVVLDPVHASGTTASLEAFAVGAPVVTWPSAFRRGRLTAGFYRKMGIADGVADSAGAYVETALRLATDPDWSKTVRAKIHAASDVLFEDIASIHDLEVFLREAVGRAGGGGAPA